MERATFHPDELAELLEQYDLTKTLSVKEFPRGSRKSPKVVIETADDRFILKRRAPGRDDPKRVEFSQALLHHLADHRLPVAPPLPNRAGETVVWRNKAAYELFRFIRGARYTGALTETADAGITLARLHRAVRDFKPTWQPDTRSFHDLDTLRANLAAIPARTSGHDSVIGREAELLSCTQELAELSSDICDRIDDLGYQGWRTWIVHGDWHPGNLRFDDEQVVAILDFDAARPAPVASEIANGLLQFSIVRDTGAPEQWPDFFDQSRMRRFWRGYAARVKLDQDQIDAIPYLMVESLIAECVIPVATTGSLGQLPGFGVMQMLRRKVRWLNAHLDAVRDLLNGS